MKKMGNKIPEKDPVFSIKNSAGRMYLYSEDTDTVIELNDISLSIYELCDGKRSIDDIVEQLSKEYRADKKELEDDVSAFLDFSRTAGIIKGSPKLEKVIFGVTGRCNLECKHCCAKESWESNDIPFDKITSVISELKAIGAGSVNLFGGEPLMRKDLLRIAGEFRAAGMSIMLNTNASINFNRHMAEGLLENDVKKICISLDGAKQDTHDMQRGVGSFRRTMETVKLLRKYEDMKIFLSYIVTAINQKEIESFCEMAYSLGVYKVVFNHVFYSGNAVCFEKSICIHPKENIKISERVGALHKRYGDFIIGSYIGEFNKLKQLGRVVPQKDVINMHSCGAAVSRLCIRPDGWVTPCEILWELKAGNIYETSIVDIWENSEVIKEFRSPKSVKFDNMEECSCCEYQFICFSGHRCYPFYYPGGINSKHLYCYKLDPGDHSK